MIGNVNHPGKHIFLIMINLEYFILILCVNNDILYK